MLLAVDPGAGRTKTIGVAIFSMPNGSLQELEQFTFEEFDAFLLSDKVNECSVVVYETYQIRRSHAKAHVGSKVEVVQSVGLLRAFANRNSIEIHEQPSRILPLAAQWFQIEWPMKDHSKSHSVSAMLHGMHWLKKNGYIKTVLEQKSENSM
jgi:hypothetical protein